MNDATARVISLMKYAEEVEQRPEIQALCEAKDAIIRNHKDYTPAELKSAIMCYNTAVLSEALKLYEKDKQNVREGNQGLPE
jgi:hypothetical protein